MSHSRSAALLYHARRIETARIRQHQPWLSDHAVHHAVENMLDGLNLGGRFAANSFEYTGVNNGRGPSPAIWNQGSGQSFSFANILDNPNLGSFIWDDFTAFGGTVTTNVGTYSSQAGSWKSYEANSNSITSSNAINVGAPGTSLANQALGAIEFLTAASAQNTCALELGYGNGGGFAMTGNTYPSLYFEIRVYVNQTSVAGFDTFVGLCEKGGAANHFLISTADAIATKSYIGFFSTTATPTKPKPAYGKNGSTGALVTNGTVPTYASKVWTKLGFVYNPNFTNGRLLQFYQDGVLAGWVTDCSIAAFPSAAVLTPLIYLQNDNATGTATTFDVDWIRAGQLFQSF